MDAQPWVVCIQLGLRIRIPLISPSTIKSNYLLAIIKFLIIDLNEYLGLWWHWWWREVDDGRLFSSVNNRSGIFDWSGSFRCFRSLGCFRSRISFGFGSLGGCSVGAGWG